nr:glutaminyl-peptide cyclotransferase [Cellvibrio sp. PSBB023]
MKQQLKLTSSEQVLNGIAWDEQRQGFWVTGKLWPKMFLIRIAAD